MPITQEEQEAKPSETKKRDIVTIMIVTLTTTKQMKLMHLSICLALVLSHASALWLAPQRGSSAAFCPAFAMIERTKHKRRGEQTTRFLLPSRFLRRRKTGAGIAEENDDEEDDDLSEYIMEEKEGGVNELESRPRIDIKSTLELPFPAEVAYDAFSDLPRQPSWSSWLRSVDYITEDGSVTDNPDSKSSLWTMRKAGIKFSWTAISTKNERPNLIKWESTSGLKNFGTVQFVQSSPSLTVMTMTMSFMTPKIVAGLFNRSDSLQEFVRTKMIDTAMEQFRDVVMEVDLAEIKVRTR